jgi:hypothetical protein
LFAVLRYNRHIAHWQEAEIVAELKLFSATLEVRPPVKSRERVAAWPTAGFCFAASDLLWRVAGAHVILLSY